MTARAGAPFWVGVEGPNGVGKTYLTHLLASRLGARCRVLAELTDASGEKVPAQVIEALSTGASFLRTGYPLTETFALVALKVREYETVARLESVPEVVLEDRGMDTVALYQAAILCGPDTSDDETWALSRRIHSMATFWRPPPDMTLLIVDDIEECFRRYARREGYPMTDEERALVSRVARLYMRLADHDPQRFRVVHRAGRPETDIAAETHRLVLAGMDPV
jgi:dTMP kinase